MEKIDKKNVQDIFELSMIQKGMLFHYLKDAGGNTYNAQLALEIKGNLDIELLKRAIASVQSDNEVLRSVFRWEEANKPLQVVLKQCPVNITVYDVSDHDKYGRSGLVEQCVTEDQRARFDLGKLPIRFNLIKISARTFIFIVTHHHILYDGWSTGIMLKEIFSCYSNLIRGVQYPPAGKRAFKDVFSATQRNARINEGAQYWKDRLAGYEVKAIVPNVPLDETVKKISRTTPIGKLHAFSRRHKVTSASVIYAAYGMLLQKYAGVTDVVFGTTVSTRDVSVPGSDNVMGNFINTVPLRFTEGSENTLQQAVMNVHETLKERSIFSNTSYPEIRKLLNLEPEEKLYDSIVVVENYPLDETSITKASDLKIRLRSVYENTDVPLVVSVYFRKNLEIEFIYKTGIADHYIDGFADGLMKVIDEVCNAGSTPISRLSLLSQADARRLLYDFNNTRVASPANETVISLFKKQVEFTPSNIAQEYRGTTWRYKDLDVLSDRVAAYLLKMNTGTGSLIGLMADRNEYLIPTILGILKAGCAYLPIDPGYPVERINTIVHDSRIGLLLTYEKFRDALPQFDGEVIDLDPLWRKTRQQRSQRSATVKVKGDDLAYVIYTSGSTGKPKGTMIEHRSLVNYTRWAAGCYVTGADSAFPLFTSFSFDLTVTSIFVPLITGGRIVVYEEEDAGNLIERIVTERKVNVVKLTPSHLRILRESEVLRSVPDKRIKTFIVGGEALEAQLAREIAAAFNNDVAIYNEYGPTEATVGCMIHRFDPSETSDAVPIGVPISNTQIYVLDAFLNPVPYNVSGELFISGHGLARGYLFQETLTQQKFIDNPFVKGKRMYRTGDFATRLPDGKIVYRGRIDDQVKLRGFRIETGEIERKLSEHAQVETAIVTVWQRDRDQHLVCYYISSAGVDSTTLREYLSARLPHYMVPAYFIRIQQLPLTVNGKLDKKRLPEPDVATGSAFVVPSTDREKLVAGIWSKVLGIENVSASDNFFMLGGDSIRSIQISSKLRAAGYEASIKDIFAYPTVQQLAQKLKAAVSASSQSAVTGHVRLTPIQQWFFRSPVKTKHHYNQSAMLSFDEGINAATVLRIFDKLLSHHDALRMVFRREGDRLVQENLAPGVPLSLEEHTVKKVKDPAMEIMTVANRIQASIDLANGPLVKLGLFHVDSGFRLLIVIHHLVIDGISWRILLEDIATLYGQAKSGAALLLPLKTDSYQSWSEHLVTYTRSRTHQRSLAYWRAALERKYALIPRDNPEGLASLQFAERVSFRLDKKTTAALLGKANRAFNTQINDLLLAALAQAVKNKYDIHTVTIDLESHGRQNLAQGENVTRTVGWFTTFYPVWLEAHESSLPETIKQVKENLRSVPNQGIDYMLMDHADAHAQIVFNYLGQFDSGTDDSPYSMVNNLRGDEISKGETWMYDWNISGIVTSGELEMSLDFSTAQYESVTIARFMDLFQQHLAEVVNYCNDIDTPRLTPADLTYRGLSIPQLDVLQDQYGIEDLLPLSPMQEGMLFHSLFENDADHYFEQITLGISGTIDVAAFAMSLNDIARRYDILRAVFLHEGYERPVQLILRERPVSFSFKDVREECHNSSRDAVVNDYRQLDRRRKFDLRHETLRVVLLQTAAKEYTLIWSHHHIVMDGWCMGLIMRDLRQLYAAYHQGRTVVAPVVTPYANYIRWLEERDREKSLHYWLDYLKGYERPASLPAKHSLGPSRYRAASYQWGLDEQQTMALHRLSRELGVTFSTILQVSWGILLSRYNNTTDVVFGSVVSGRPASLPGVEDMVGLFINTIPVRVSYTRESSVIDLLKEAQASALESETYQYHPLAEIQARHNAGAVLFDHIMVFENFPVVDRILGGAPGSGSFSVSSVDIFEQTNYDLSVVVVPGSYTQIRFDFNANVYDSETIQHAAAHWNTLLTAIISGGVVKVAALEWLTAAEKRNLLTLLDNTAVAYPRHQTVHALFEAQARRTPDSIALTYEGGHMTYHELDKRSDKLAFLLREKGVGPDQVVGLLMDRSMDTVAGMLAILKAGGAYLPIDVDYPDERIHYLIEDSGTRLVLTSRELRHRAVDVETVLVEDADTMEQDVNKVPDLVRPSNLCYVIYTSGTTGNPKGVMVEHGNVVRLFFNEAFQFNFDARDVWTMFHSHCFDFSVWEIYGAILFGGRLVIIPKMVSRDTSAYLEILKKEKVTVLNQTPTAFYNLVQEELNDTERSLQLRYVIFGGEALSPDKLRSWRHKYPAVKLINMFGITETTVHVTYKEISEHEIENNISNVGRPIPTLSVYVLDEQQQPVPPGVVGELFVGGAGVSRGYLGKETLTSKKFVPNPYKQGDRLYRSGDLARILHSGDLEYIGRMDDQVKIRGFRIELGEVEHQVAKHTRVKETVVLARETEGTKHLICYYLSDEVIGADELRDFLSATLPEYMIPAYYVRVEAWPLTFNGKLDRRALPEPDGKTAFEYTAPSTPEEELLSEIWSKVLGVENIGVTHNFFLAGGDSIKSIQICSRVRSAGYSLTVKDIFSCQTIKVLAPKLKKTSSAPDQSSVAGVTGLTPIQQWFFNGPTADRHHYNQSVMLHFSRGITAEVVRTIFEKLLQHHDALRMVFREQDGKIIQEHRGDVHVSISEHDLRSERNVESAMLVVADRLQRSIDLAAGPLLKLALFHTKVGSRLLIVIHHLVVDGVSWRILFEDIETLYAQITSGASPALPLKSDSFHAWSLHLQQYASGNSFQVAKQYWDGIAGKEIPSLATDHVHGDNTRRQSRSETFGLTRHETKRLLHEVHTAFNTRINDILLTALLLAMSRKFGVSSIRLDLEGHGREDVGGGIDISRTVGWFTSIYPVVLAKGGSLTETIKAVKETLRAVPNNGIDYLIRKYNTASGAEDRSRSQMCFNYLGQFNAESPGKLFSVSRDANGERISPDRTMEYEWNIAGIIVDGRFELSITYSDQRYDQETITGLLNLCHESLIEVIDHCCMRKRPELTRSDLTCQTLTAEQLDRLQQQYVIDDVYPLSPMQEGMLFHTLVDPESEQYFEQITCNINGPLDIIALRKSLAALIRRYDTLRTIFLHGDYAHPLQVVLKECDADFTFIDVRQECENGSKEESIRKYQQRDRSKKFDVTRDVLTRLSVLHTGNETFTLIWSHHHIIMDGWCMRLVMNDFQELYAGYINHHEPALAPVTPYARYIQWLEGQEKDEHLRYWKSYLSGYDHQTGLPQKEMTARGQAYRLASQHMVIGNDQAALLAARAAENGITISTLLHAAWAVLLARYNHTRDVVFGSVVSGRPAEIEGIETMVGLFINTIPVRIRLEDAMMVDALLKSAQRSTLESEPHHYCPLPEIQASSDLGRSLLDHILIVENFPLAEGIKNRKTGFEITGMEIFEQTSYDLSVMMFPGDKIGIRLDYNANVYDETVIQGAATHLKRILDQFAISSRLTVADLEIVTEKEKFQLLHGFNDTAGSYPRLDTITSLFERQASETPDKVAVIYEGRMLTYAALNALSNRIAYRLRNDHGVGANDFIAIMAERSELMIAGLLGILKSGGAYVPLDPTYPKERLEYILADSRSRVLLTAGNVRDDIEYAGDLLRLENITDGHDEDLKAGSTPEDICYLIYTSGSTGKPKGVMVLHRNVTNFFAAMSAQIHTDHNDCMLAVTSTSFDISVLEIFWTLCNGVEVVLHPSEATLDNLDRYLLQNDRPVDFSLFFFSSYNNQAQDKYNLLLETARYADRTGFNAVWTPERHFHEFGGLYANPSVTSAALAMITEKIELRSGSIVSPLHDAIRIAEEWSLVDNLSGGRTGLSFASGWNPNDFALAPDAFRARHDMMYQQIDEVRRLWKGEHVRRKNGFDQEVDLRIFPEPIQKELPVWITSAGNEETFRSAGAAGSNVLTHLLGQEIGDLARKIDIYRQARKQAGFDPEGGKVAVMLHAYIGDDPEAVEKLVEKPFTEYLKSAVGLNKVIFEESGFKADELSDELREKILKNSFKRYYQTSSLIGTKSSCSRMVMKMKEIGADEIACLIDFGLEEKEVMVSLEKIKELKDMFSAQAGGAHKPVTMMQSTPSFMNMASQSTGSVKLLRSLRALLLGGEAVPLSLVRELKSNFPATLYNMYGPTETTIWSCMHEFPPTPNSVSVGKPILNTQVYILDSTLQLVPAGISGDLYIGGEGVSAGYWNRPELTAERFINNPYQDGSKIYRTGDIARWLHDGTIELLGREDQQVKIRGHRIELGEIEEQLSGHEQISESAVVVREKEGDKILVAYYVSAEEIGNDILHAYLSGKLPDYMLPSHYVHLSRMPLTPNGKVDRKALPDPQMSSAETCEPPTDEVEKKLVSIWADVLHIDPHTIGVNIDFFKLGGHSLNAIATINRIEKMFDRSVPLQVFLNMSTIREIAMYIRAFDGNAMADQDEDQEQFTF